MMSDLFWPPRTGQTLLDRWSIVHFAFFLVLGADWCGVGLPAKLEAYGLPHVCVVAAAYFVALTLGLAWELAEGVLEQWGLVKHPESKLNRWVSDPIVDLAGFAAGYLLIAGQ